jgi:hypothetical protein
VLLLASILILSSCSGPLKLLTGGGPNVAANTQVAKQAVQTIGSSTATGDQKIEGSSGRIEQVQSQTTKVRTESVDKIVVNEVPPWIIFVLLLGWLLPSPNEIVRWFTSLFKRKKDGG